MGQYANHIAKNAARQGNRYAGDTLQVLRAQAAAGPAKTLPVVGQFTEAQARSTVRDMVALRQQNTTETMEHSYRVVIETLIKVGKDPKNSAAHRADYRTMYRVAVPVHREWARLGL